MGTDRCAQPLEPLEDTAPAVDNRKYHHSKRLVAEWPLALELSRSRLSTRMKFWPRVSTNGAFPWFTILLKA